MYTIFVFTYVYRYRKVKRSRNTERYVSKRILWNAVQCVMTTLKDFTVVAVLFIAIYLEYILINNK